MYNPTCSHCKRKILSHCLRIQCDQCLHNFHCSCMMVTHEEYYNTTTWTCTTCRDDIFPFQSVTDMELQNLLLNYDGQYSLEYWCLDQIEFAKKIWIHLNWMISTVLNQTMKSILISIISMMSVYQICWNVVIMLVSLLVNSLSQGEPRTTFLLCTIIFEVYQQTWMNSTYF